MRLSLKIFFSAVMIPALLVLICYSGIQIKKTGLADTNPTEHFITLPCVPIAIVSKEESSNCPVYDKFKIAFGNPLWIFKIHHHFISVNALSEIVSICHEKMPKYLQTMCFKN